MKYLASLAFTLFAVPAWSAASSSGGSTSGGGEVLKDARNPWFVQNTTDVTYCIAHDPNTFHQSPAVAKQWIEKAIGYWKEEFSHTLVFNKIEIATQSFHEVACSSDVDIRFQFGTLTTEQKLDLPDPSKYVALARRIQYDPIHLRGKGFVYIAADSGPNKPDNDQLIAMPWSISGGGLLYRVLVHELGHVFGIPDSSSMPLTISGDGMMSAAYPEYVLYKDWAENLAQIVELPNFFKYRGTVIQGSTCYAGEGVGKIGKISEFYGIPSNWSCYKVLLQNGRIEVYGREHDEDGAPYVLIGIGDIERQFTSRFESSVNLWLPKEQVVYKRDEATVTIMGPSVQYEEIKATYKTTDGKLVRQIFVQLPLNNEVVGKVGGIVDNKIILNAAWGI